MRVLLLFNTFTTASGASGHGHVRIELPEGRKLTQGVLLRAERELCEGEGYTTCVITSVLELDA